MGAAFDPFAGHVDRRVGGGRVPSNSLRDFSPGILALARGKKVVEVGDGRYHVYGTEKELLPIYEVEWRQENKSWWCSCYDLKYGDVRARKGCSHVAAVIMYRNGGEGHVNKGGDRTLENTSQEAQETAQVHVQRVLDGEWVDLEAPTTSPIDPLPIGNQGPVVEGPVVKLADTPASKAGPEMGEGSTPSGATVSPSDEMFQMEGEPPLPAWVAGFRDHQWNAFEEIIEAYKDGADIVWLDAPTGTGKTLIAEMVDRGMKVPAWYTCSTKSLQEQILRDFPYSAVLMGRANYPTATMPYPDYTAADCTKSGGDEPSCYWCPRISECPYEQAKSKALGARLGVLNTRYLLTEGNGPGRTKGRGLVIADECDLLESELMATQQFELTQRRLERLGLEAPGKGVHKKTILTWLEENLHPMVVGALRTIPQNSNDVRMIRERLALDNLLGDINRIVRDLHVEMEVDEADSNWVRDNDAGPMVLKPVRVNAYGPKMLWPLGEKWLCMSATIISPEQMNEDLGVYEAGLRAAVVTAPMTFPVAHRPLTVAPVVSMRMSDKEKAWPQMAKAIGRIMEKHPRERILVHTVSYAFAGYLMRTLRNPRTITYSSGREREQALSRYRRTEGAVLLAPSMDRGIDLRDDDCRVQVICKVPFPSLGDKQVSARLHGKGGQQWYNVQTVRTLVQMTGRGVRSAEDWAQTYILDAQFLAKIWNKRDVRGLLPKWWQEAVEVVRIREYV